MEAKKIKMKKIIINKNLKFNSDDLMQFVDMTKPFTLRDVFNCIQNSKVTIEKLKKILKCRYLEEYMEEINKPNVPKKDKDGIKYLEIYCGAEEIGAKDNKYMRWSFHGVGKKDKFTDKYALEFSPLYEIADFKIRISDTMLVFNESNGKILKKKVDTSIMLIELLYAIVWELSWNGSIENREKRLQELKRRVENIKN